MEKVQVLYQSKKINPIGDFEELFHTMMSDESKLKTYKQSKNMSEEEKYISFMNKYFIFQKVNNKTKYKRKCNQIY